MTTATFINGRLSTVTTACFQLLNPRIWVEASGKKTAHSGNRRPTSTLHLFHKKAIHATWMEKMQRLQKAN
jgi:hypothetical protein